MKRRQALKKLTGAAAALGGGLPVLGNIEPTRRRYGAPATLSLRRVPEENLLHLSLARAEIPYGIWDEATALARLAARVVQNPESARAFARDPAAAFRDLGYDASALRLDDPEIRACLLLADEEVQHAIADGDALGFIRALRDQGVGPTQDYSQLRAAYREALEREATQGLRAPLGTDKTYAAFVVVPVVAVAVLLVVVAVGALLAVAVGAYVYVYVSVSGSGAVKLKMKDRGTSLFHLAAQTGDPSLSREVQQSLLDEISQAMTEAALEAADIHGIELSPDEAAQHVRSALSRVMP